MSPNMITVCSMIVTVFIYMIYIFYKNICQIRSYIREWQVECLMWSLFYHIMLTFGLQCFLETLPCTSIYFKPSPHDMVCVPQDDCHHCVLRPHRAGLSGELPVRGLWLKHHQSQRTRDAGTLYTLKLSCNMHCVHTGGYQRVSLTSFRCCAWSCQEDAKLQTECSQTFVDRFNLE